MIEDWCTFQTICSYTLFGYFQCSMSTTHVCNAGQTNVKYGKHIENWIKKHHYTLGVFKAFSVNKGFLSTPLCCIWSFDNRFEVNWPPEPTLVLRWISKFFLFGALPSDTLKIKHTKNLKEIPSRHVLENILEKSKHSCLYTSETY